MKMVFGVVVIILGIYLGVEFVPPYYANYEFEDAIKGEALFSTNTNSSEETIRDNVYKRAQQLEIPIAKETIVVHKVGLNGSGSVSIDAPYTVHVDLLAYPVDLVFNPSTLNKGAFR
jgi:hypothetical protein